jgi:hypothetical protein
MRFTRGLWGLLLLLAVAGCDSTQPDQIEQQNIELTISAGNAIASTDETGTFNVWDVIEEPDGQPFLWCEFLPITNPPLIGINASSVPWGFSIKISIIRAGETRPDRFCKSFDPEQASTFAPCDSQADCLDFEQCEVETSNAALNTTFNTALYDTTSVRFGQSPDTPLALNLPFGQDTITIGSRTFRFTNPRQHPAYHFDVMTAADNPLAFLLGGAVGNGLCNSGNPGPSVIDGEPQPWTIALNKGDTIVVEARRGLDVPPGLSTVATTPQLSGTLRVDGREVEQITGVRTETAANTGISFSYTAR